MKIGILGTGFGVEHIRLYQQLGEHQIIVYGRNKEKLNEIKNEFKVEVTDDLSCILQDHDIKLIDVCLPSAIHEDIVIEALKYGKDVFCETPLALSIEAANNMFEASKRHKRKVLVNQFIKFEYPYQYLIQLVKEKTYGALKALHMRRLTPPLFGDLGLTKISPHLMIHECDLITEILGLPNHSYVRGVPNNEHQSHVNVTLDYENCFVDYTASSMMPDYHPFTVSFEAVFEEATLEYYEHGYSNKTETALTLFTNHEQKRIDLPSQNCFLETFKEVITKVHDQMPSQLEIGHSLQSTKLAIALQSKLLTI